MKCTPQQIKTLSGKTLSESEGGIEVMAPCSGAYAYNKDQTKFNKIRIVREFAYNKDGDVRYGRFWSVDVDRMQGMVG